MLKAARELGIVFFPAFDWAISPTHPERQERLLYTLDQLREEGVFDIPGIGEYKPDVATIDDVDRAHFCFPDTEGVASPSHLVSAGGAIRAGRLIMEKKAKRAFAMVRPPGHHAMKCVHGARGFCNINIEAVMIERLREEHGPLRVAIVDTDCHHGDGTQDIYWHDPDTLFISLHQDGRTLYPGTGFAHELGGPGALGTTVNVPLPPGTSDEGFLHVAEHLVRPLLDEFRPDLVVNSAGQDNHFSDPLTDMAFSAQGYARLTDIVGADIAVLEGGYAIQGALPYVNLGIVLAMAGLDYSHVREPGFAPDRVRQGHKITEYIKRQCEDIRKLAKNPPRRQRSGEMVGEWFVRRKTLYYDTDHITEYQVESLLVCPDCPGVLKIESESSRTPLCLGVQIPIRACPRCHSEGIRAYEQGQLKGKYRVVRLIDRKGRQYLRYMG
ncbi:histone deacetylase family protein [Desulfolutivibrio sulfoxidireducens]|uniref:histone deacetylase family protein n=1 Tax=Desulfolutivibrio sulfoxidireducens TaxID=2773299 RepID=UPI00159D1829|nr:histone deacetylase [Desulfolutivibrio sulfoxidireducens]QLA18155.1 histone deacetylase [Desulfolutivibrio sulfoxidireducens]